MSIKEAALPPTASQRIFIWIHFSFVNGLMKWSPSTCQCVMTDWSCVTVRASSNTLTQQHISNSNQLSALCKEKYWQKCLLEKYAPSYYLPVGRSWRVLWLEESFIAHICWANKSGSSVSAGFSGATIVCHISVASPDSIQLGWLGSREEIGSQQKAKSLHKPGSPWHKMPDE